MSRTLSASLLLLGIILITLSCGCAASKGVVKYAEAGGRYLTLTEPILRGAYESNQLRCLDEHPADVDASTLCVEHVRARWAPILEAIGAVHKAYCDVAPDQCGGEPWMR